MTISIKKRLLASRIGYILRIVSHLYRLPKHIRYLEQQVKQAHQKAEESGKSTAQIMPIIKRTEQTTDAVANELSTFSKRLHNLDDRFTDLNHKVLTLDSGPGPKTANIDQKKSTAEKSSIADDHTLDNFYVAFEDRFRGSEDDIKKRLEVYLPYFMANERPGNLPVIDLGCGRGELLSLMYDHGIKALGVDLNKSMVDRAKTRHFQAVQDDAIHYLNGQRSNSASAITGFHIVEHLPFGTLLRMFDECYRVIAPGGFALFETPNPENITVGACNFYLDPSHLNPIPPALLAFTLETRGFSTEIIRLHPLKETLTNHEDELLQGVVESFYGARDYAVIARKT